MLTIQKEVPQLHDGSCITNRFITAPADLVEIPYNVAGKESKNDGGSQAGGGPIAFFY
jgi:hypothetical protein